MHVVKKAIFIFTFLSTTEWISVLLLSVDQAEENMESYLKAYYTESFLSTETSHCCDGFTVEELIQRLQNKWVIYINVSKLIAPLFSSVPLPVKETHLFSSNKAPVLIDLIILLSLMYTQALTLFEFEKI